MFPSFQGSASPSTFRGPRLSHLEEENIDMVHCLFACLTIKPWPLCQVAGSLTRLFSSYVVNSR